ncbi:major capsid protein [Human papillomavirus 144]|uniref:Major capsid protein L1 n=3 Tax=Papillomaviridae TaxID=151340 RepID=I3P6Q1_9PAPI|nr:major capsid protein [Human papillomavirus 144]AEM24662.1 major capsid protein [Human papillomavirus 144]
MAQWTQKNGILYLPPPKPVARVLSTDEYIVNTDIFFHANTERLLTVGHPYFEIRQNDQADVIQVPKVSASQYRVMRMILPDPNRFALIEPSIYNPEHERLVWKLRAIEIGRGGPLGISSSGHPLFNKLGDTENPNKYMSKQSRDNRQDVSFDPKQTQLFIVGCTPSLGEHWDVAPECDEQPKQPGDCPAIELVHSIIEDGDMCDIGLGNVNFVKFQEDRSGAPLDVIHSTCKWPDFLKMTKDIYGDQVFFFGKKEQLYARHFWARAGVMGDAIPSPFDASDTRYMLTPNDDQEQQTNFGSHIYFTSPSGSLTSSDGQLFNRPYFLQRAQGANNGICWGNQLFLTLVDNTHGTNFTISVKKDNSVTIDNNYKYNATDFKQYTRHVEEYEVELIFQLAKVPLNADVLAHIHAMNPSILEEWQLGFVPPPPQGLEDTYRYITSMATRCPSQQPAKEKVDPYARYNFWKIDMTERFSTELSQFSLGKRFLYQTGLLERTRKRPRTDITVRKKTVKRRRTNV